MDMRAFDRISDMLCEEIERIAQKGELDMGDLEITNKAIGTIKNICKIKLMKEDGYSKDGYSSDGDWMARGAYGGVERGRAMSSYRRGYSRGYSGEDSREVMMRKLEDKMRNASESERKYYERAMELIEQT